MRRIIVDVSEDLADRISRQAVQESRPFKWHIVRLLELAADVHARGSVGELAENARPEVFHVDVD